ncbi:chromate efflux transporter [Pseudomonas marincola]|uniref:chromate efflux transporter n=1 Tax=Pseudomonas marincola TaxID=437900 RepID=UPI0008F3C722|nr:chromate efflux transporter [Pseudomonas marincola]SFU11276.1 chromate transporter [Pseudomonas marincola]
MRDIHNHDRSCWSVFLIFLKLGLTSFGGPVAHLGFFREEFVSRRRWLSEHSYADLVALCQFLPGPASSQVGMALGLSRAGYAGALSAWAGFTLPSAIVLILFALGISEYGELVSGGMLHGLKVVAVAVVAQAVWGMGKSLCPDWPRKLLAVLAAAWVLLVPSAWSPLAVILLGAVAGLIWLHPAPKDSSDELSVSVSPRVGVLCFALFLVLLLGLPVLAYSVGGQALAMIDGFYRAGALVFGGGHVVLPLLQAEVVGPGWISNDVFVAGYGAAQAVPGPLFTFSAFLGASMNSFPTGWLGGLIALLAIFLPSFLLVAAALPFWQQVRSNVRAQAALAGVNAAVVGLLLAALYQPVWTSAIEQPADILLAAAALLALMYFKLPAWLVVIGSALIAGVLA